MNTKTKNPVKRTGCFIVIIIIIVTAFVFDQSNSDKKSDNPSSVSRDTITKAAISLDTVSSENDMKTAIYELINEDNIKEIAFFEALETLPSTLNVQFVIDDHWDEKDFVNRFVAYSFVICKELETKSDIGNIRLFGYMNTIDDMGNINGDSKVINFISEKDDRHNIDWDQLREPVLLDYKKINSIGELSMDGWLEETISQ